MKNPFVSIILPVRNEGRYIRRCLQAVISQDYSTDRMEILVVDGGSTDDTRPIILEIAGKYPQFRVNLMDNPHKTVPYALNIGLRKARGEIILRVDGHCEIAANYVSLCVAHLENSKAAGVGGLIHTIGESYLADTIAVGMSSFFGVGGSPFRMQDKGTRWVDTVAFPAYWRETVWQAGPFDEELVRNQDDEYNYRIRKMGGKILLASDVRAKYFSRSTLPGLWRQYFQYGFWKVRVLQKHPWQMSLRQFVPPIFVLTLLVTGIVTMFRPFHPFRFLPLLILVVYLAANLFASISTAAVRGWKYAPLLPVIYLCLHWAYGLGFLTGLFRFANRWGDRQGSVPQADFMSDISG